MQHPSDAGDRLVTDVWRREAPHVLAALLRRYGHLEDCEDAAQEAFLAASLQWPGQGPPQDPRAWLLTVASRRLVDRWRSESSRVSREERAGWMARADGASAASAEDGALAEDGLPAVAGGDDTLGLLLLCCHPALTPASAVALTLRAVAGLSTAQIAAAFFVPEATMAQRISRAKATLRRQDARLDTVPSDEVPARLAAVLRVLYLVFTEGHASTGGSVLLDVRLTEEAIRLTRQVTRQVPDHAEAVGLLALMLLTDARRAARTDRAGDLIPLADQDRTQWDRDQLQEGVALVEEVLTRGHVGPYQVQAAIAAVHADAATAAETDWLQICVLYRMLASLDPSPAVNLNLAVAVGMAHGPEAGLALVEPLLEDLDLARHHRTHAVRAHLLELAGRREEAGPAYLLAAQLTRSQPEQRYLLRRARALAETSGPSSARVL